MTDFNSNIFRLCAVKLVVNCNNCW